MSRAALRRLSGPTARRFLLLALTQASFSATSLAAAVLISELRDDPKQDLALLGGVTLGQGIVRLIVGLNLALDSQRSRGAGLIAAVLLALAGLPYASFGYQWWLLAAIPTVAYELSRITLTRVARERQCLVVFIADLSWLVPFLLLGSLRSVPIGTVIGLASVLAATVMLVELQARSMLRHASQPGLLWWRERRPAIGRSAAESISGALVPFGCAAALITAERLDDVNALRAAAQVMSPQGSLVGVVILLWPQLSMRRRSALATTLVTAPVAVPVLAIALPGVFASLSADSSLTLPYALGWAAFGCSQTRVAFSNADRRVGVGPRWNSAAWAAVILAPLLLGAAIVTADTSATRLALAAVCGIPWVVGLVLNRSTHTYTQVSGDTSRTTPQ